MQTVHQSGINQTVAISDMMGCFGITIVYGGVVGWSDNNKSKGGCGRMVR